MTMTLQLEAPAFNHLIPGSRGLEARACLRGHSESVKLLGPRGVLLARRFDGEPRLTRHLGWHQHDPQQAEL